MHIQTVFLYETPTCIDKPFLVIIIRIYSIQYQHYLDVSSSLPSFHNFHQQQLLKGAKKQQQT